MDHITCRTFTSIRALEGLSLRGQEEHYELYTGYVAKYNQLVDRFTILRTQTLDIEGEYQSLKLDLTYALSAVKNHELFFEMLDDSGPESPGGELAEMIHKSYGSLSYFMRDLKQTALNSRGWAWTTYDLDQKYIFNYAGSTQQALPVWNAVPLLAVDMYGHAYLYDYGNNRSGYADALLSNLDWGKIAARFERVRLLKTEL